MFKNDNNYINTIKNTQTYSTLSKKTSNKKIMILNLSLVTLLGYLSFNYINKPSKSLPAVKQAVLGVYEVYDDSQSKNDTGMKTLKVTQDMIPQNTIKVLVAKSSIQSKSSYTEAISRKLDDKSGFKGRIAVVNQNITLDRN